MINLLYKMISLYIMQLFIININGLLKKNINNCVMSNEKTCMKSSMELEDYHYEYQYDWISGEVPWEFIETDKPDKPYNNLIIYDKEINKMEYSSEKNDIQIVNMENSSVLDMDFDIEIEKINTIFEKNIFSKAILSGAMKGIYNQIISIDNAISYTECYTNKIIEMDIILTMLYAILYEKSKFYEKNNIISLKKYNNIEIFEKYIKLRRSAMLGIIIIYVLLFRGVSIVQ